MGTELYPLTLEPIIVEQFWGRSVSAGPDESVPQEFTLGTLWMATENSRVAAGPQTGRSLGYLKQIWGEDLVGTNLGGDPDGPIPVELKLKRTGEAALAVALTNDSLWYFLNAEDDSSINAGYMDGLDFERAAAKAGGDPGRWAEFMPEYPVENGSCLRLPAMSPLLLGAGLTVAQIGPPAQALPKWPLPGHGPQAIQLAQESLPAQWLEPRQTDPGVADIFQSDSLKVRLITTVSYSGLAAPEAVTFLWPVAGQGRIRSRGPAPATRLSPGRVLMLPSALGRYAVESSGGVTYLHIEARST